MEEEKERTKLLSSRGKVHQVILDLLTPGKWVAGKKILQVTGQSYYDRRIRELRDEEGWKIITEFKDGQPGYRLISVERGQGKKRHYPSKADRDRIFQRDKFTCQLCGVYMGGDNPSSNPQIDHKIPLIKGGNINDDNLQVLCHECNVIKRGACSRCSLQSCEKCFYAFPTLAKSKVIINLPPDLSKRIELLSKKENKTFDEIVIKLLTERSKENE